MLSLYCPHGTNYAHRATLAHRNISHSVSSVDLIGPRLTTQHKIHIQKN